MTIAHPAPHSTTREQRALAFYRDHGDEIVQIAPDVFRVPSQDGGRSYDVLYGEREECPCPDHLYRQVNCVHILAVGIAHAKKRFTTVHVISAAGDPFYATPRRPDTEETPHFCYDGWVFLGYEGVNEDGELVEVDTERVPCRRCRPTAR